MRPVLPEGWGGWYVAPGPRTTPSPLERVQVEALLVTETQPRRLNRAWSAVLALFAMEPDRRIELWSGTTVFRCSGIWRTGRCRSRAPSIRRVSVYN